MDLHARIAHRVRSLRAAQGISLDVLAQRSGVSRSNISLIERGESSPTAVVLDKLSAALGVTVASLFEADAALASEPSPVSRAADQACWTDPGSGYVRRNVSPPTPGSPLQLVEVNFPAGQRIAFDHTPRDVETHQQVWILEGSMELRVGERTWQLNAGDCLAMRLDAPIVYRNATDRPARYVVALSSPTPATPSNRRSP